MGELRVIVYLEDLGEASQAALLPGTVTTHSLRPMKENATPNEGRRGGGGEEYSSVFELEVWKRAEM